MKDITYFYRYRKNNWGKEDRAGQISFECNFFEAMSEMRNHLSEDDGIIDQQLFDAKTGKLIVCMKAV